MKLQTTRLFLRPITVGDAIFVTGLAAVGLKVLLTPDSEWVTEPATARVAQPVGAAIGQPS
jgi:hypothetical protein